ncbi:uncharacterized protein AMSG_11104 [Thecamonas trahens ATCC 50062]|uniref:Doublecortin domain-containing protein n=1 Tax=Thecamonas trahens ATCC 50062 TaxID=461836 RepID=A0A0L0DTR1_THETB|nr:hypothetical protein AMSG_11104 [Thecamonas trahens ATCC 50062]KNC55441.1 hypothetical protein AMSG_11104 [Thecamonas trahens ATCC 50062]|eukprot:XP_013752978.1 hypothetical protein AMSG_11104 [Thecamonas trahens ATCC 50062]
MSLRQLLVDACAADSVLRAEVTRSVAALLSAKSRTSGGTSPVKHVQPDDSPLDDPRMSRRPPSAAASPAGRRRPPSAASAASPSSRPRSRASRTKSRKTGSPERGSPKRRGGLFDRLPPKALRVRAFRNGYDNDKDGVSIAAKSLDQLLTLATAKLNLNSAARRIFRASGVEVKDMPAPAPAADADSDAETSSPAESRSYATFSDLAADEPVFVSMGEAWVDPKMRGIRRTVVSTSGVGSETSPSKRWDRFTPPAKTSVVAFKNGSHEDFEGVRIPGASVDELLISATAKLPLTTAGRALYLADGSRVVDSLPPGTPAYASPSRGRASVTALSGSGSDSGEQIPDASDDDAHADGASGSVASPTRRTHKKGREPLVLFSELESGTHVFVSCGEPFRVPGDLKPIISLIRPLPADSRLLPRPAKYFQVLPNGKLPSKFHAPRISGFSLEELLAAATFRLGFPTHASALFTEDGAVVVETPPEHLLRLERQEQAAMAKVRKSMADAASAANQDAASDGGASKRKSKRKSKSKRKRKSKNKKKSSHSASGSSSSNSGSGSGSGSSSGSGSGSGSGPSSGSGSGSGSDSGSNSHSDTGGSDNGSTAGDAGPVAFEDFDVGEVRRRYVLLKELQSGTMLWASRGEPWLRPGSRKPLTKRIRPLPEDSPLIPKTKKRLIVLMNGENLLRKGKRICGNTVQDILHQCHEPLGIAGQPKLLFLGDGKIVVDEYDEKNPGRIPRPPKSVNPIAEAKKQLRDAEPITPVRLQQSSQYGRGVLADASWRGQPHLRIGNSLLHAAPPLNFGIVRGGRERCVKLAELGDKALVWVSCGESFKSLVPSQDKYNPHPNVPTIRPDSRLLTRKRTRVFAYKNGWFHKGTGHAVVGATLDDLLNECTTALSMILPATILYTEDGERITDITKLEKDQIVFAAHTPPFRRTDEPLVTNPGK